MKETLEILLFGLFGFWIILIPMILIVKIKYYKKLRHKNYSGIPDLFAILTPEFWIAGITFGLPIFGKDQDPIINRIRKNVNKQLYRLYGVFLIQMILVIVLNTLIEK